MFFLIFVILNTSMTFLEKFEFLSIAPTSQNWNMQGRIQYSITFLTKDMFFFLVKNFQFVTLTVENLPTNTEFCGVITIQNHSGPN